MVGQKSFNEEEKDCGIGGFGRRSANGGAQLGGREISGQLVRRQGISCLAEAGRGVGDSPGGGKGLTKRWGAWGERVGQVSRNTG